MAKFELFIHGKADKLLEEKRLYQEIKETLGKVRRVDHREIQEAFADNGWTLEHQIFPQTSWTWDAHKDRVAVSVQLSLIDRVHRDFLRAIQAKKHNELDALVCITSTFRDPRFHNVKRDIEIFNKILSFPILLVGLT